MIYYAPQFYTRDQEVMFKFIKQIYQKCSSMKTGLILLGLISLVSAIGTGIFPDGFPRTTLFRLLILFLFINMFLCTASQSKRFINRIYKKQIIKWLSTKQGGTLLLHTGIILVLIGGGINSIYGQTAQIIIKEGDTISVSKLISSKSAFKLKLNKFEIKFNPDGSPAQYYSGINIISEIKPLVKASISVNHPLKYEGVKLYQESFGYLVVTQAENGGKKIGKNIKEGETIKPPGTSRIVRVYKYIPNYNSQYGMETKTLRPDNPRVMFSVYEDKNLLGVGVARLGEPVKIDRDTIVKFKAIKLYSVINAKTDPGLSFTCIGGVMLVVGVFLALFISQLLKPTNMAGEDGSKDILAEDNH